MEHQTILGLIELFTIAIVVTVVAFMIVGYLALAGKNRELTASFRDDFLDTAVKLVESNELPEWAVSRLISTCRDLFSRRKLYRATMLILQARSGRPPFSKTDEEIVRAQLRQIPAHHRAAWDRATVDGFIALSGAEPILGLILRSQLIALSKMESTDNRANLTVEADKISELCLAA